MINKRRKARERRLEKGAVILTWARDVRQEVEFERALADTAQKDGMTMKKFYQPYAKEWGKCCFSLLRREIGWIDAFYL
jgi:hypothetical protein